MMAALITGSAGWVFPTLSSLGLEIIGLAREAFGADFRVDRLANVVRAV